MSRGHWIHLRTRTRKGITLTWAMLFLFSLLLQYAQFAAPRSALATVGGSSFELDGNIAHAASHDWDQVFADDQNHSTATSGADSLQFITDKVNTTEDDIFTGGGSKDDLTIQGGPWLWTTSKPQPKDDITHAFAAAYTVGGDTIAYFGLDKYEVDGDNQVGFWFFKNKIAKTDTSSNGGFKFSGEHAVGDILVLADYTNGGSVPNFKVFKWVVSGGSDGSLDLVANTGECNASNQTACGVTNSSEFSSSAWPYQNRDTAAGIYPAGALFEGGLNLTDLDLDTGCFSTFLAETRSSQSVSSTLSDIAMGSFSFCVKPDLETNVSDSSITIGQSVTDTATLTGTKGAVEGTIKFYVCGPEASDPDCSNGGDKVGATKTLAGGEATSDAFTPPAPGHYCFRAEYTPEAGSHYLATEHTNKTTECFTVAKKHPQISTTASQTVLVGGTIHDVAHLSGTFNGTGTITFKLYGPNDTDCSAAAIFTDTAAVDGNGDYTSANFTTAAAGTYRWIARYGGDDNNTAVSGACGDADESVAVGKLSPSISTNASADVRIDGAISDVATIAGATAAAGGTITFKLYGPDDATCAGAAIFTDTVPVSGNGDYSSGAFSPSAVGTYRWIASYSGDANNAAAAGACNDEGESVAVTKAGPQIATSLVGGGKNGASITVALGTAVHDTSTLTGASAHAGGTVTYTVFSDETCDTFFAAAGTTSVVDGVPGNSDPVTFSQAGTYYWQAVYSGDANNTGATSSCNSEIVTVSQNIPQISTTASGNVKIGGSINDVAHLSGTFNGTGSITFRLYGPNDATCTGQVIFQDAVAVQGNGDYASASYTTAATGIYRWVASYSGDGNNAAVSGACNDASEAVSVSTPRIHAEKTVDGQHASQADPGDTLHYEITVTNEGDADGNATVSDDISALLAWAGFDAADNGGSLNGSVLSWPTFSLAAGATKTLHFTVILMSDGWPIGATQLPNTVVVVGTGSNCPEASTDADCSTDTTVNQPRLTIVKDLSGNTGGTDPILGVPSARIGDTLLYTLTWTLTSGPVHNAVITDVLPVGLTNPSSISDGGSFDPATRTITWHLGDILEVDATGFVTYKIVVLKAAAEQPQPLVNVATIDSDETPPDTDDAVVAVQGEVKGATPTPHVTPPATSSVHSTTTTGSAGFSLMLILITIAAVTLSVAYFTPAPATARRRDHRGRPR